MIASPSALLVPLFVLLTIPPPTAEAQGFSFALPQTISSSLSGARSVSLADMDLDGDLDIVAAATSSNIVWIENLNGDISGLTRHFISEFGGGTWDLDVGDINRDGIPDVLATRTGSDAIQWFRRSSLSSNTWTMVSVGTFAEPTAARLADMDSDGDLDVVFTSDTDNSIRWRRNDDGLGTSWSTVSNLPINGAADFAIVDLDRDGDLDFVVAGQTEDEIRWYQNTNGEGTLWQGTDLTGGLDGAWSVDVGDIDHDGDLDIVASGHDANEITLLENSGASPATFTTATLDDSFTGARRVRLVDIDQDGDLDILGIAELSGELALWENWPGPSGVGGTHWRRWSVSKLVVEAWAFEAGDLDGDGDLDLVTAGPFISDPVIWFRNDSPHSQLNLGWGSLEELAAPFGTGFESMTFGDIDDDGKADMVAGGQGHLGWWSGIGSVNPSIRNEISSTSAQYNNDIELADLDRDGDLDIIVSSRATNPGNAYWWENEDGGVSWTRHVVGTTRSSHVEVVDLFGSGELVVVTAGPDPNDAIRAHGPPFTSTGGQHTLIASHGTKALAIGDLDQDGDLDLVAGGYGFGVVDVGLILVEQDGVTFTEVDLSASPIDDLDLIDWDRDGDLDIVAVNKSPGQILWFENIPGATWNFVEHDVTPFIFGDPIHSYDEVVVGDIDRDGRNEIWAVNTLSMNPPDGGPFAVGLEWGGPVALEILFETRPGIRIQPADIDQDGDDDWVILDRDLSVISSLNVAADVFHLDGSHHGLNDPITRGEEYRGISMNFENVALDSDGAMSLDAMAVRWESRPPRWPAEPGQVLGQEQVTSLIDNVRVFFDDGDTVFDENLDTLLIATHDFAFEDDRMILNFPPGLATVEVGHLRRVWFFLTPKLSAAPIDHLGIVMDTLPTIRHLATDSPIHRGFIEGFGTGLFLDEDPNALFRDGFESGSTSEWSGG